MRDVTRVLRCVQLGLEACDLGRVVAVGNPQLADVGGGKRIVGQVVDMDGKGVEKKTRRR